MSKSTNHTEKSQVAGYGLHYYANNQLIPNTTDRAVMQCLIDMVRKQLAASLDNQTIIISMRQLSRITGVDAKRTLPACLQRLENLGLIKKFKNGIFVCCDEYVELIYTYESLAIAEREQFVADFLSQDVTVVQKYTNGTKIHHRSELLGLSGSSIPVSQNEWCNNTPFSTSEIQNGVKMYHEGCNNTPFTQSGLENGVLLYHSQDSAFGVIMHHLVYQLAEMVHYYTTDHDFSEAEALFDGVEIHHSIKDALKYMFETGKVPESLLDTPQKWCIIVPLGGALLHHWGAKSGVFLHPSNNIYNNKNYKGGNNQKNEVQEEEEHENFQENIQKGFASFGKVEVIDFSQPSEEITEGSEEIEEFSQQKLKRAERSMRARNPYRNKPFIKVEKVKEIVDCLDEVVKSPVDFFLYQFWWGIFDLYCDHYHSSSRIDEEGEVEEEPQSTDWKEMIGAALPQDEIYSLAQNIYEDMVGAIEQGKYVYGDNNEWEVKFGFKSFQDFNPYEIFQWIPCTMQDKSVPALRVAIDRFYDIEANDVFTASKGDKKTKNSQNKKLIELILSADDSSLTPMEIAIKSFYRDFVVSGEENVIDEFTDGKGTALESGGGLPDHLLKPWCYNLPSVGYNELTGALCSKYKPCDGVHKKAYIFSAENVAEWNERNGYTDTIAHQALQ